MKITFLLPYAGLEGGVRVVAIYAQMLQQRCHQVTVVSLPRRPVSTSHSLRQWLGGQGWPDSSPQGPSHLDQSGVPWKRLETFRSLTPEDLPDADVLVATWWETVEWIASMPASKGRVVHFMQDYEIWAGQTPRVDRAVGQKIPKIVIAQWVADLLKGRFGQHPLALIPNGIDLGHFNAARRLPTDPPTVGLTYTTMFNKGTDISLKAFNLAARVIPNLRLVAFGSQRPTRDLPLPKGADYHFQAPDAQLPELYARCNAWLFATRREGFGLPILEAMACRTPVLGTPAGAAPELLAQGGGWLVAPEDPAAMADAIIRLCALSPAEWQALSHKARSTAESYRWDLAVDRFEEALQRVHEQGAHVWPSIC